MQSAVRRQLVQRLQAAAAGLLHEAFSMQACGERGGNMMQYSQLTSLRCLMPAGGVNAGSYHQLAAVHASANPFDSTAMQHASRTAFGADAGRHGQSSANSTAAVQPKQVRHMAAKAGKRPKRQFNKPSQNAAARARVADTQPAAAAPIASRLSHKPRHSAAQQPLREEGKAAVTTATRQESTTANSSSQSSQQQQRRQATDGESPEEGQFLGVSEATAIKLVRWVVIGMIIILGVRVLPYIGMGTVDSAIQLLSAESAFLQKAGASRITSIAAFSDSGAASAVEGGAIPKLLDVLGTTPDKGVQGEIVKAIVQLSKIDAGKDALRQAQAVPHLKQALDTGCVTDEDAVAAAQELLSRLQRSNGMVKS